jgi:ATP-dependent DNA helicase MPH1
MCYTCLREIDDGADNGQGKKTLSKLRTDPIFVELMAEVQAQRDRGFELHPKMDTLRTLLVNHFAELADQDDGADESRVMVFVTYRAVVDEVVEVLNREDPLIRAIPFIGQGTDKKGKKGYDQKKQLDVSDLCRTLSLC